MANIGFLLEPLPPFRLDLTAWALRRCSHDQIDRWDGETFRRVLVLRDEPVEMAVRQTGPPDRPKLEVIASSPHLPPDVVYSASAALEHILGLKLDLAGFYRLAAQEEQLGPLAERFRGVKPPCSPTPFEALVDGIACQRASFCQGATLINRLSQACGVTWRGDSGAQHAFPEPWDLAHLPLEMLLAMEFSEQKGRSLIAAAQTVAEGQPDLDGLAHLDIHSAASRLDEIPGVGRATADYVLLCGLGRLMVFPTVDAGARSRLQRWLRRDDELNDAAMRHTIARWQPYAGMVYSLLLLLDLAESGQIAA